MNTNEPGRPADGVGTLVAPIWVVTAAHIATLVSPGHVVTIGGREVEIADVFVHPEWNDGAHDIALIRLSSVVDWADPVPLYRGKQEQGSVLLVAGVGDTGTGLTGATGNDGRLRAARNRVDQASDLWLKMRFDIPEAGLVLEGISGPGDSGGPGLIEIGGAFQLAGVSSGQSARATGEKANVYGVTEYYTRVSSYGEWLRSVMAKAPHLPPN